MHGPLEGIKVLDLTRVLAGPFCCSILGDMGAEVVKVERAGRGDDTRDILPKVGGESLYFQVMNRNKFGISLNFRHPKGPALLKELVRHADVLVENFRGGTMDKMGCGYETLKAINPRLVMVSISGFGQDGPYSKLPCYDVIAQAMSGFMEITGQPDGPPTVAGTFVVDYSTGLYAVVGTLAALRAREHTGVGQLVDVALLDTAISYLVTAIPEYLLLGKKMTRVGNRDRYCAPANLFRCKDGKWVFLACATDSLFPRLLKAMGRPDLCEDPRFATHDARIEHVVEGEELLAKWVADQTADEVVARMAKAELPCAKVASIDEVVVNPQVVHRGMVAQVEHPTAGRVPMQGVNIHLSETPGAIRRAAPLLGEHNEEVYARWLGLSPSDVAGMKAAGLI
jgi:crotonobetainyl-CoA:carnitine CoA-transferase CaiB-like acyl-CoA transferase